LSKAESIFKLLYINVGYFHSMPHWEKSFAVQAFIFGLALIPLTTTPVLPLIDFYNHIARFYVLAHVSGNPLLQRYYQARWSLLPDIGVDIFGTPLMYLFPPLIAAKLIAAGIMAILFSGVMVFNGAVTGRSPILVSIILAPLLYSYVLNWGFANFLLGLGITFWAATWWVKMRNRPAIAIPVSCLLALAIFFSHGVAFMLYGVLVASYEIGDYWISERRGFATLVRALAVVSISAILPVAYFLFWKSGGIGGGSVPTLHLATIPFSQRVTKASLYHLRTILRVEEGPSYWFDVATFGIQAVAIASLFLMRHVYIASQARFLAIVAAIIAALPLPTLFGVGYIADRLPLFAALVLMGILAVRSCKWTPVAKLVGAILIATTAVRIAAIALSWHSYAASFSEFLSVARRIPPGSLTEGIAIGSGHHESSIPRCEMYGPILITNFGQVGPLFADEKQQPLRLIGPLSGSGVAGKPALSTNDAVRKAFSGNYDHVLLCNIQLLPSLNTHGERAIARTKHFALLVRRS
jgi:hypothetical protein